MLKTEIDNATLNAINIFLARIKEYDFSEIDLSAIESAAILFGSCARGTQTPDSDIDLAIIFQGALKLSERTRNRFRLSSIMAGIAFDVMSETEELINAIPIFEDELNFPEKFSNPIFIENIKREGILL
jgi:predicted nucleotidyltransferase